MKFKEKIFDTLNKADDLPTLPGVFMKLSNMLHDDDASAADIAHVMKDDPSLTAKLLKIANSAAFGASRKISSVPTAVARLGFQHTADIVMSLSILNLFEKKGQLDYTRYWIHCLSVAFTADALNEFSSKSPVKDVFTGGILHDVGVLILDQYAGEQYASVVDFGKEKHIQLYEAEKQILGLSHAEAGAFLLEKWNLPENLVSAVRNHHSPLASTPGALSASEMIYLANFICNNQGIDSGFGVAPDAFSDAAWHDRGFAVDDIPAIIADVYRKLERSEVMLAVASE